MLNKSSPINMNQLKKFGCDWLVCDNIINIKEIFLVKKINIKFSIIFNFKMKFYIFKTWNTKNHVVSSLFPSCISESCI